MRMASRLEVKRHTWLVLLLDTVELFPRGATGDIVGQAENDFKLNFSRMFAVAEARGSCCGWKATAAASKANVSATHRSHRRRWLSSHKTAPLLRPGFIISGGRGETGAQQAGTACAVSVTHDREPCVIHARCTHVRRDCPASQRSLRVVYSISTAVVTGVLSRMDSKKSRWLLHCLRRSNGCKREERR
jgi:hypothetical protein